MEKTLTEVNLTQYSHGAGCGCKISPEVLDKILESDTQQKQFKSLIVGNKERDDAAVMDLGDGSAVISTTDFFMPIVDDPYSFGKIAAVNAISDVYAMGGTPLLAIAILGWPVDKLSPAVAAKVIEGGKSACAEAGIPLAGGHSIDSPEPIFGLAVTGKVQLENLKTNSGAKPGAKLFLTKPLGVGILSTAEKKGLLKNEHSNLAVSNMLKLNKAGEIFGALPYIEAMTDVTGFGLLGHLVEMCQGSNCSAELLADKVPLLNEQALKSYIDQGAVPGGTHRNWKSYGHHISFQKDLHKTIFSDPQTSGGLLVAVNENSTNQFEELLISQSIDAWCIGHLTESKDVLVTIH